MHIHIYGPGALSAVALMCIECVLSSTQIQLQEHHYKHNEHLIKVRGDRAQAYIYVYVYIYTYIPDQGARRQGRGAVSAVAL